MRAEIVEALGVPVRQEDFAELVGVSQTRVSQMLAEHVLEDGGTGLQWLLSYTKRLRDQAAGRDADGVLSRERAALSREQRIGQEIKNRIALGEYAPIGLLSDVLATASSSVVDRFDSLRGQMRKACPDLPAEALDTVERILTSARNEWIRSTAELIDAGLAEIPEEPAEDPAESDLNDQVDA